MKQSDVSKQTIAWFKLAEYVSRGEKERALGMYRLLSHSIPDRAFVHQLAGDLFLSFADVASALERYAQAALGYRASEKVREAIGVCTHMVGIDPSRDFAYVQLLGLYDQLQQHNNARELLDTCAREQRWQLLEKIVYDEQVPTQLQAYAQQCLARRG